MKVTRADWHVELQPLENPQRLEFERRLSPAEAETLRLGIKPREMEDHWFVFEEDGVVHLVRSWTGIECFTLRLEPLADGEFAVTDVMVSGGLEEDEDAGSRGILEIFIDSLAWEAGRARTLFEHVFGAGDARESSD
jgi:hypothetical protein